MHLKQNFVINDVAGEKIAVAVGNTGGFKGYIRLNDTAKDIFELLKKDTDRESLISALSKKYPEANKKEIVESVDETLQKLTAAGLLI